MDPTTEVIILSPQLAQEMSTPVPDSKTPKQTPTFQASTVNYTPLQITEEVTDSDHNKKDQVYRQKNGKDSDEYSFSDDLDGLADPDRHHDCLVGIASPFTNSI